MPDTQQGDNRPIPDPTILTTEASVRLEAMLRNLIQAEITHQNDLFNEKFVRIEAQFRMLDERTAEQKKDTKDALDAALAAQKEAVASQTVSSEKSITKSETATIERIKAVETLLSSSTRASDDKINDLKSRIVALEAVKLGSREQLIVTHAERLDSRGSMASIISIIAVIVAVASVIVALIIALKP